MKREGGWNIAGLSGLGASRRGGRPEPPSLRRQASGVLVALVVVLALDLVSAQVLFIPNLGLAYFLLTIGVALGAGLWAALATTAILTAHVWLVYRYGIPPYSAASVYGPITATHLRDVARDVRVTALSFGFWSLLIGLIQMRLRTAGVREFDARERARSEAVGRAAAETGLRSSEEMRRLIVDSTTDAVVVVGTDGRIAHWNPNAQALFGWSAAEATGLRLEETILPGRVQGPRLHGSLEAGSRAGTWLETRAATESGDDIEVEVSIVPHDREEGRLLIVFLRDIRERKAAEAAIHELNASLEARVAERTAQLERANAELIGFNYSVSHDLRTPLRAIVANSRILVEESGERLDAESLDRLQRVERAAMKMGALIESLLQFARVGQVALKEGEVAISEIARTAVEELRTRREGRAEIQPGLVAHGDPQMLGLVVTNLLENAWKYVRSGEAPDVAFGRNEEGAFFVRDHGIGFDMAYVDKIWQPFERLHRDEEYPGTGIGLANCRRIVQRHDGRMWAESRLGQGTTVFFTLGDLGA